jgi:uncharacterized protein involved in response to NO
MTRSQNIIGRPKDSLAIPPSQDSPSRPPALALFAHGFTPFFLSAGVYALLGLIASLWMYATGVHPLPSQPAQFWHAHEMLYGIVLLLVTVIGGRIVPAHAHSVAASCRWASGLT